jgi:methylated-DNA-[protein]-cysteine S-methyltransferase
MAPLARLCSDASMDKHNTIMTAELDSPIGAIRMAATDRGLCALEFTDQWYKAERRLARRFGGVDLKRAENPHDAVEALAAYLRGDLRALDAVAVDPGGTPFQQKVWQVLRTIQAGQTLSYGQLAAAVDLPTGPRAVGAANGSNPVSIIIPCHRVIRSDGSLCGYGGGLERKHWLLTHEGVKLGP